jgi:hypothetical protein
LRCRARIYFITPAPAADEIETNQGRRFRTWSRLTAYAAPALYVVERGGRYTKVCDADRICAAKIRITPGQSMTGWRAADFPSEQSSNRINATLGATRVTSIEYTLAEPSISEISLSDLGEIEDSCCARSVATRRCSVC